MRIFVSWSGNLSQRVALIIKDWIPNVIQTVDLYVSSEDIDKGTRWASDISKELAGASLGIICLTRSNLTAPWILFEAGALSKSIERARVVPLLIDLSPSDVEGPLVQFQASTITKEDIRKMVEAINASMGDQAIEPTRVERSFQKWWPELERSFQEAKSHVKESPEVVPIRSERELLEETLDLTRQISKASDSAAKFVANADRLEDSLRYATYSFREDLAVTISTMMQEFRQFLAEQSVLNRDRNAGSKI